MHRSTNYQAPPNAVGLLGFCDKAYYKLEICFRLYFESQIVTCRAAYLGQGRDTIRITIYALRLR